jgi:hypothetical protein
VVNSWHASTIKIHVAKDYQSSLRSCDGNIDSVPFAKEATESSISIISKFDSNKFHLLECSTVLVGNDKIENDNSILISLEAINGSDSNKFAKVGLFQEIGQFLELGSERN